MIRRCIITVTELINNAAVLHDKCLISNNFPV
jgi:hypothetical protein